MQNSMAAFFLLFSAACFTNPYRFSFCYLKAGKVRALLSEVKMEMLISRLPLGETLWPPGSSLKIASVCLAPLLSQIQSPSWLPGTEISLLYSRAIHLCTSYFYISHCGLCPLELLVVPWRLYSGFLIYSMQKAGNLKYLCPTLSYLYIPGTLPANIKARRKVISFTCEM